MIIKNPNGSAGPGGPQIIKATPARNTKAPTILLPVNPIT